MYLSLFTLVLVATTGGQDEQIQELRSLVNELRGEVSQLKHQANNPWLTEHRTEEIRNLVHDVLADADTRVSMLGDSLSTGYKSGFYISSADANWKLKMNGQIQVRWLYNDASEQRSQHGFEQRRTKIKFSGHVLDPSWAYAITTSWSRTGTAAAEDAWIAKSFDDGKWFKFGQFKSGFLRENIVSSSKQLGADRSMLDNAFTYGWSQGVAAGWKGDDSQLYVHYTDGPGRVNTAALGATTNAWIVRGEMLFGETNWKDFAYLTSKSGGNTGLLLGVAYENYDTDVAGGFEYGNAVADQSHGWTIDAQLRGDGWNVFAYTVNTRGEDKATGVTQDSSGWLLQGGMLVSDQVELFAQYQRGNIDGATFGDGESRDMSSFRVGINYWPVAGSNNVKWTSDIGWAGKSIADGAGSGISSADWTSSGNGWRDDTGGQDGQMLIRTQLQLLF